MSDGRMPSVDMTATERGWGVSPSPSRTSGGPVAQCVPLPELLGGRLIDSDFAHSVAHDLRSPLTVIHMCAEMLVSIQDPAQQEKYALVIAEQATAMAWALENLVTLADDTVWSGADREQVDLADVVRQSLDDLEHMMRARGVTVRFAEPAGPAPVEGVLSGLHQAVRACLQVLLSVTPTHGYVGIAVEGPQPANGDQPASLLTLTSHAREALSVTVSDSLDLPWHRMPLRAASHLFNAHGGAVMPLRESGRVGLQVLLPAGAPPLARIQAA